MDNRKKNIDYNTKISKEDFESLRRQSASRNQAQMGVIESRFSGGTLSGLQSKLRTTVVPEERLSVKSIYKDKEGRNSRSLFDINFKSDGIGKLTDVGYFKDNL